uniref:Transmembrane protein 267 n=1 Tax=Lygus hesperus TaxID=30085 RepID=A0A0A9Y8C5_LYGHE
MQLCLLFTASICLTALIGDKLVDLFSNLNELKALADSSTHGLIGVFSWAATLSYLRSKRFSLTGNRLLDIGLCGIIASVIDLDHFYAAKSFSLTAATSLDRRPPLHCTSLWLIVLSLALISSVVLKAEWLWTLASMIGVAVFSHHIRDATRRGIWLWPVGSTPPIPYFGYILLLTILPLVASYFLPQHAPGGYSEISTV